MDGVLKGCAARIAPRREPAPHTTVLLPEQALLAHPIMPRTRPGPPLCPGALPARNFRQQSPAAGWAATRPLRAGAVSRERPALGRRRASTQPAVPVAAC